MSVESPSREQDSEAGVPVERMGAPPGERSEARDGDSTVVTGAPTGIKRFMQWIRVRPAARDLDPTFFTGAPAGITRSGQRARVSPEARDTTPVAGIARSTQRERVTSGAPEAELASVRACRPPQRMRRARRRYEP
ncbi:hypothetical protein [Corallococcus terminator]|uniref:Uncharacterized protein n=1 Tax=Corallococcus terminator TaxID=2316733 RepID=A0A3A8IU23_9BACT|nr:hypothetical protein [Corallococcus terminator]RKG86076.1 hypothetical protein D7V88_18475 [Corallococcus terminator]